MEPNNQNAQTTPPNLNDKQIPQEVNPEESNYQDEKLNLSMSLENMEPNIAAALAYIMPPFSGIGMFLIERGNKFVRFHSFQSILFGFIAWGAISISNSMPIIGDMLSSFLKIITIVLWLFLMWKAYNKEHFELPFIGKIANDQTNK